MFSFKFSITKSKSTVDCEPYTAPNGVVITGPMADHMRAMVGIGRAFDPINYDKNLAMEFANKPIEKSEVPVAPPISDKEKEAIITASITKTESEVKTDSKAKTESEVKTDSKAKADSGSTEEIVDRLLDAVFGEDSDKPKSNPNAKRGNR